MMKDKSLKLWLASLFRQGIPGRDSSGDMRKLEKAERVIEDILRWANSRYWQRIPPIKLLQFAETI
jgi:hypothetical protein